jgi:hypothetical protein
MSLSVCLVDRPSPFRSELQAALEAQGNRVELWDDSLTALAGSEAISADIIAVGEDNDATASSLLRVLERRGKNARIYRLTGDVSETPLPVRSARVPRSFGAASVAATLLRETAASAESFACDIGAAQLGQTLLWLLDRRATGVLLLQAEGYEREIAFVMGMPAHTRSTQPSERLGAIALKQGLVQFDQLDAALTHARASGLPLGKAMIDLSLIDASKLFALLARQTREQVEAACSGGPYKARFRHDHRIPEQLDLYPMHPMTALLGAATRVSPSVLASALERAANRAVIEHSHSGALAGWLAAIGVSVDRKAMTFGALRKSVAEQTAAAGTVHEGALMLALLGAGMRIGEAPRVPGAVPSLPPPVGANLMRVLDSRAPFKPPITEAPELLAPEGDWQRALHDALVKPQSGDASATFLRSPEDEQLNSELRTLYVLHKTGRDPFEMIGVAHAATQAEIDLAYCARLEVLDRACADSASVTAPMRKLELRRAFDRAHAILTQRAAAADSQARASTTAVQIGRASSISIETPTRPLATALEADAASELEPMFRKASWDEIASWVEQKHPGGNGLSPALALLYALALKEAPSTPARAQSAAQADRLGIRAVSELLGVGGDSAIALVVAKRALRKRQLEWQKEPPKRFSILLMLIALAIGAAVGLAFSQQSIPLPW